MLKSVFAAGALALLTFASSALPAWAVDIAPVAGANTGQATAAAKPAALSPSEAAALQFMREEEKLAHDVYVALGSRWGLPEFSNIAGSEQQHTDAVAALLARYRVSDPAVGKGAGVFTNPDLQALYNELMAQGGVSTAEALRVGGLIEEVDILDLQERIAATKNADILRVYSNLLSGSENHLRAFVTAWESLTGQPYTPQQLAPAEYERIVGATGRGNANRGPGRSSNGGRP